MVRAFSYSLFFHTGLLLLLIFSARISLSILKARKDIHSGGVVQIDMTYKPSDSAMRQGPSSKDLPPPLVEKNTSPEAAPTPKLKEVPKLDKGSKVKEIAKPKKNDLRSILDKIRRESKKEDERPIPKDDNFPTRETGEKNARGTGGRATRALSPAEQALQSAMRRHFELEEATAFRKQFPGLMGYLGIKLQGSGNQFRLLALGWVERTGQPLLDRKCELAVRAALDAETFSADVISELSGKETTVVCQP